MRVEITLTFEELPGGFAKEDIQGTEYGASSNGMQSMKDLDPHTCMAYCLAFMHSFHAQVAERQKEKTGPKIEIARAGLIS